ncbi:MAG: hypothetical protein IKW46_01530 [Bacteroidaceae bacterium]|nr:hypothetical protein [Bacteroidaceae bacterium]
MKRTILLISALVLSGAVQAQTGSKNAVVNVENDYNPEVIEVRKKNLTPSDETNTDNTPMTLMFSKSGKAYNGFTSETDISDILPKKESVFPGYVRLGYGLTNDIDAKAAYRLSTGKNGALKAYAGFNGYKTDVDHLFATEKPWNSRMFNTIAGIGYSYRFKALTLGIDGAFKNSTFNYQCTDNVITPLTDKQDGQSYRLAISGTSNPIGALSYSFNGDIEYIARSYSSGEKAPIGEMRYGVGGNIGYEVVSDYLKSFGIGLHLDAFSYNGTLKKANSGYGNLFSIDTNPYLDFTFGKWAVGIGTKMNIITRGNGFFAIAPNIKVESHLNKNITLFGYITGGRTNNSFAKLNSITPYWGFVENGDFRFKPTYRIVDAGIGSRISFDALSIGLNAGYTFTKDDLLETLQRQTNDQFTLMYVNFRQENTHHAFVDLRLGYDLRSWLKLSADARYDFWSCKEKNLLVMKPQFTVDANAEIRVLRHLTLRAGYNFTRYTKSSTQGRLSNKNDLYARISYQINKRIGAYIQGNNLLNCKYFEYAGYATRGIRGSLGATVNF